MFALIRHERSFWYQSTRVLRREVLVNRITGKVEYWEPSYRFSDKSGLGRVRWDNLHNNGQGNQVIWVGTIEISYLDHEDADKRKNAFTVVTTWASSAEEFRQKCELMLESYGWKLLDIDKANPAPDKYDYNEEVADQLERTRANPNAIIYGTFYTYPVM